jgi:hypothetical protein
VEAQQDLGSDPVATFPGRTVTLGVSAAQAAYLRTLLYEDLQQWAEALAEHAHSAAEIGGVCGIDARDTYRRLATAALLDVVGWDTADDGTDLRWLEAESRRRLDRVRRGGVEWTRPRSTRS